MGRSATTSLLHLSARFAVHKNILLSKNAKPLGELNMVYQVFEKMFSIPVYIPLCETNVVLTSNYHLRIYLTNMC